VRGGKIGEEVAVGFSGMEMRDANKSIIEFIDLFFEDHVREFKIEFDGLLFTEDEFNELLGYYDGSNGVNNNGVHVDEYTYDVDDENMKKLTIEYIKRGDGKYEILSIEGFNDKKLGDSNE